MMIDHVNAVVLPVRDVEKCASFYQDKLGFKLNYKDDQSAFLAIGGKGGLVLGLVSINEVARLISEKHVRPREETVHRTYYAVFVEDVDREYEELKQKGVHFVKPPATQPWGQRIAYFEDPEGNLWEVSHFPKKQRPERVSASSTFPLRILVQICLNLIVSPAFVTIPATVSLSSCLSTNID